METKFVNKLDSDSVRKVRQDHTLVEAGMGGTYSIGSDDYAFEVIEKLDDNHLICRELTAINHGDMCCQKWEFFSDTENATFRLAYRNGKWRKQEGRRLSPTYESYFLGEAYQDLDPSF